jgi:hypothetical protein
MSPTEVTEKLGLMRMKDRSWFCHPSNALAGDGLFEGSSYYPLRSLSRSLVKPLQSKSFKLTIVIQNRSQMVDREL